MDGHLVDTDVCIDFLKGKEYTKELFDKLLEGKVFISVLSIYELFKGAYTLKQRETVEKFLKVFTKIDIDENISKIGSEFYTKYRKKGITLGDIDCLIMATAKMYNLKIVTRNVKHFPERELLSEFTKKLLEQGRS